MRTLSILALIAVSCSALAQAPGVEHVLVIGIDGLGPIGIEKAETPNMRKLIAEGAHTLKARGVMPTSSSPNWASMIAGAGPEQHGVLSNDWPLPKGFLPPVAQGPGGMFPTMFGLLREQRPQAVIGVVHDWDGFARLLETKMCDFVVNANLEDETAEQGVKAILEHRPTLLFVHFDNVDHELHGVGFATDAYFAAVTKTDRLVGKLLEALAAAGIADKTAVLLTSDHGGKGKSHGGNSIDEFTIPWIIAGPGIAKGKTIEDTVNTFDTAATVAHLLGLTPPQAWIARPVLAAFQP